VSKDHLDAHRLADGATRRFANTKGGHKAIIKWVAETPLYRVVFEPTGLYHRAVERALKLRDVVETPLRLGWRNGGPALATSDLML
jgi:transposase